MELINFLGKGPGFWLLLSLLVLILIALTFIIKRSSKRKYTGRIVIAAFLIELGVLFGILAMSFPVKQDDPVGAGVVPLLWIYGILILGIFLLIQALTGHEEVDPPWGRMDVVGIFLGMTILYVILMQFIGYSISTFAYLISGMYYLKYRKWKTMLSITIGWILFSYFAFYRLLYVPLPKGILIERIFG
jgi:putative tricarboxylic transport membrane protein